MYSRPSRDDAHRLDVISFRTEKKKCGRAGACGVRLASIERLCYRPIVIIFSTCRVVENRHEYRVDLSVRKFQYTVVFLFFSIVRACGIRTLSVLRAAPWRRLLSMMFFYLFSRVPDLSDTVIRRYVISLPSVPENESHAPEMTRLCYHNVTKAAGSQKKKKK